MLWLDDSCSEHYTVDDLIETLCNINVAPTDTKFCTALYTNGKILSSLQDISNIYLDKMYYRPKDLDMMIKKLVKK